MGLLKCSLMVIQLPRGAVNNTKKEKRKIQTNEEIYTKRKKRIKEGNGRDKETDRDIERKRR
jgi:hypothetical protein